MRYAIKNGTEVFVINNNEITKGTIIDSYRMERSSEYISNDYIILYTVLGENNYKFNAAEGEQSPYPRIFLTKESCINYLNAKIMNNNKEIAKIQKQNDNYLEMIESLNDEKTDENQKSFK